MIEAREAGREKFDVDEGLACPMDSSVGKARPNRLFVTGVIARGECDVRQ